MIINYKTDDTKLVKIGDTYQERVKAKEKALS